MSLEELLKESIAATRELTEVNRALINQGQGNYVQPHAPQAQAPAQTEIKKPQPPKVAKAAPSSEAGAEAKPDLAKPVVTREEAARAVIAVQKEKGRDGAVALLAEFGAKKLDEVPVEQYGALIAKADEVLKVEELA